MARRQPLELVIGVRVPAPQLTFNRAAVAGCCVPGAAPEDCLSNPNCGVGLEATYRADIAVAFSSNPGVSRPAVLQLRDDRGMVGEDHVVPVIRRGLLAAYGRKARRDMRRRIDAASRELGTLDLRRLNQQLEDGQSPGAVGAEFIDDNGLGGDGGRKRGPRITIRYMGFAENTMLAHLYAEALRTRGYRVRVRAVGGLRPQASARCGATASTSGPGTPARCASTSPAAARASSARCCAASAPARCAWRRARTRTSS